MALAVIMGFGIVFYMLLEFRVQDLGLWVSDLGFKLLSLRPLVLPTSRWTRAQGLATRS